MHKLSKSPPVKRRAEVTQLHHRERQCHKNQWCFLCLFKHIVFMFPLFLLAQAVSLPADSQTRRPTQVTHKFSGSELSPQTLNLGLLSRFHLVVQNISESSVTSAIRVDGYIINSAVSTLCFSTTFVYTGSVQRNELYCTNSHIKQVTEHGWQ